MFWGSPLTPDGKRFKKKILGVAKKFRDTRGNTRSKKNIGGTDYTEPLLLGRRVAKRGKRAVTAVREYSGQKKSVTGGKKLGGKVCQEKKF